MCLAVPGKIIEIKDDIATVDYDIEKRKGKIISDSDEFSVGDYVLVQGGIVVEKIPEDEAKRALELYKESVKD